MLNAEQYYDIADDLLTKGTNYQKRCIKFYTEQFAGTKLFKELKHFIDIQIELGRIELN